VRLEAILQGEEHIIGPKLFGKGVAALTDPLTPWDPNRSQGANRGPAMELCEGQEMLFANTFKAPQPQRTVSYRDKWQKPTKDFNTQGFNVLDHVITHRKWLPVIKDIRNRPDISFPSDHFIIQTTLNIKLGAKRKTPNTLKPIKYTCESMEELEEKSAKYNEKVWDSTINTARDDNTQINALLENQVRDIRRNTQSTMHNWESNKVIRAYTDGSCFENRHNTENTPAGWGYYIEEITEAYGPVNTNTQDPFWLGAKIGSNNTGELQAIAELFLYIIENITEPHIIKIGYDSKIAANMARGIWKPKKTKN